MFSEHCLKAYEIGWDVQLNLKNEFFHVESLSRGLLEIFSCLHTCVLFNSVGGSYEHVRSEQ